MRRYAAAAAALALLAHLAGCRQEPAVELTVAAAASLREPLTTIAQRYEDEQPRGVPFRVRLTFAGSAELAAQLRAGAPFDVVATADEATMRALRDEGLVQRPVTFASNRMAIAVPQGNPAGVTSLEDLAAPDLRLVVCAVEVPCGASAEAVADGAGLALTPASREQSVTDVLGKVASGEAEAGLVYASDVRTADDVEGIEIPDHLNVTNSYPAAIAVGGDRETAHGFPEYLTSEAAQTALRDAGFAAP